MTDAMPIVDRSDWAPLEDMATAAHELGHAFGARETGLEPGKLIVHKWLGGGHCELREGQRAPKESSGFWWSFVVALAAGRAGEEIWRGRNGILDPWSWGTAMDDAMIAKLIPEVWNGTADMALNEARDHLNGVWDELDALIIPLAKRGYLPGIDD